MPISVCCNDCGKDCRVKDEVAGKKMKCKDCGAVIAIPSRASPSKSSAGKVATGKKPATKKGPAKDPWDEEDPYGKLDLSGDDDLPPEDDEDTDDEPPARRGSSAKSKSSSKSKPKRKRSSSGASSMLKKIGGGVGSVFFFLVVLGQILRVVGIGGGAPSWREYSPPTGEFKVQMPADPKATTRMDNGITSYIFEAKTSRLLCGLQFVTLPLAANGPGVKELAFGGYIQTVTAAKPNAKIIGQRDFQFRNYPCREWEVEYDGAKNVSRAYLLGTELFALQFISPKRSFDNASMNTFFDSFDPLVGRPAGAPGMSQPGVMPGMPQPGVALPGMAPPAGAGVAPPTGAPTGI